MKEVISRIYEFTVKNDFSEEKLTMTDVSVGCFPGVYELKNDSSTEAIVCSCGKIEGVPYYEIAYKNNEKSDWKRHLVKASYFNASFIKINY